jgi:hypothetical protein
VLAAGGSGGGKWKRLSDRAGEADVLCRFEGFGTRVIFGEDLNSPA